MIKFGKYYLFILSVSALLLVRCIGFEPILLTPQGSVSKYSTEAANDGTTTAVIETPKLVDGVFEDFQKELNGWWGSKDVIKFSKEKDFLKVEVTKTGPGFPQFGFTFEPKDFTNTPVVRIKMRAQGNEVPKIRVDLRDVNDLQTNATLVMNDVAVGDEYIEYYFDFNNKYKQSWPGPGIVDPRQITGMTFFVNPGDKPFTGTLYIKEIYVMANKDGSGIVSKEFMVDDFSGDINYWWGCDKEKVLLSKEELTSLKIKFKNGQWSCFGMSFDPMDVSANPVIKLRLKVKSPGMLQSIDIVPWFTDANNKTSNKEHLAQKVVIGTDYTDYFFDYNGKLESKEGVFDPKLINSLIIFINTLGGPVFNGDIYVDEVSLLPSVPAYVSKRISLSKPTFIDPSWPKGSEAFLVNDFKNDVGNWKSSSDKGQVTEQENGVMKINSATTEPGWEYFTKKINAANFIDKPVLRIRVKAEGNSAPYLRIILTDNFGKMTNGRPAEEKIELKNSYVDYFFDFSGRFQQRFPEMANVNPGAIEKISFYLNGGLEPFNGNLLIDEIETLTITDYLKVAR